MSLYLFGSIQEQLAADKSNRCFFHLLSHSLNSILNFRIDGAPSASGRLEGLAPAAAFFF